MVGWGGGGGWGSVGGAEGLRRAGAHLLHMPVVQTPQLDKWLQIDIRQMGRAGVSSFSLALALANYLLSDTLGGGTPHVEYRCKGLPRCPRRTLHSTRRALIASAVDLSGRVASHSLISL